MEKIAAFQPTIVEDRGRFTEAPASV